jgi:hypothetical protein
MQRRCAVYGMRSFEHLLLEVFCLFLEIKNFSHHFTEARTLTKQTILCYHEAKLGAHVGVGSYSQQYYSRC